MKFKRSVKVVTILAILVVTLLTLSIQDHVNTPVHAHSTATDPNVMSVTVAGNTYSFTQVAGSSASNTDSSIDTGNWTVTQGTRTVGTIDINEAVSNSVTTFGKYAFQTSVTSTIPGLQGYSSSTRDYPVTESGYGGISVSPWGDQAAKYTSNDYAVAAPDSGTTTTNTSTFQSLAAAGSTGYQMYNNMISLNNAQKTAYQNLQNFVANAGTKSDVGQPSTSAIPMAFHSPAQNKITIPNALLGMSVAGLVVGTAGAALNAWCSKTESKFCGSNQKAEDILAAIGGMLQEVSTWALVISGWSLLGAHIASRAGNNNPQAMLGTFVTAAEQAFRNVMEGVPFASQHGSSGSVDTDIEAEL